MTRPEAVWFRLRICRQRGGRGRRKIAMSWLVHGAGQPPPDRPNRPHPSHPEDPAPPRAALRDPRSGARPCPANSCTQTPRRSISVAEDDVTGRHASHRWHLVPRFAPPAAQVVPGDLPALRIQEKHERQPAQTDAQSLVQDRVVPLPPHQSSNVRPERRATQRDCRSR